MEETNSSSTNSSWLIYTKDIELGGSSVLGGNYIAFYIIHIWACTCIFISLTCCACVITSIVKRVLQKLRQGKKGRAQNSGKWINLDISDRFPLYLAVADTLLMFSHLTDHLFLLITHRFPSPTVSVLLSLNLWIFLAYQQIMHAGLALFTYLRIVRETNLNLGTLEWKLHSVAVAFISASIAIFYPLDAFGSSGFWMLVNFQTTSGTVFSFFAILSCSIQACCTIFAYSRIRVEVKQGQKTAVAMRATNVTTHSTASQCLSTLVKISILIIGPTAVLYTAIVVQGLFGILEPVTIIIYVSFFNSIGTMNAFAYFYNMRIKAQGKETEGISQGDIATSVKSTSTTSNLSSDKGNGT